MTSPRGRLQRHRVPWVGRNGTGSTRATGSGSNGTNTGGNSNTGKDNRYACCCFLSLFLYFHLFFILLFFFSDHFFSENYSNRRDTKGESRADRTGYTWATIATWDGTEGAGRSRVRLLLCRGPFYSPLLLFSFFFFSDYLFFSGV